MSGLRLWQRGALGAALLGVVVGCAGSASGELPLADGLGGADVAVYVTQFTNDATTDGRVLLYDRGGPVSMVSHQGIRVPGLIWDDAGLFFVDQTTDFQLSDRLERHTRSRAADTLVGMQGGPNGRRVVLFNDGLSEGKNHTGVGVYSGVKEESQQTLLDSMAESHTACGAMVVAAGRSMEPRGYSELVDLGRLSGPKLIGRRAEGDFLDSAGVPCVGGSVVGIGRQNNDYISSYPLEIWQWNVANGSVHRTTMVTAAGDFVGTDELMGLASMLPQWVVGGNLHWIDASGSAWQSNIKTGMTMLLRRGLPVVDTPANGWIQHRDWVVQFVDSDGSSSAHLNIYSAKDLSLVETRELPRLDELTPDGQMVLAVAVSPGFAPSSAKR